MATADNTRIVTININVDEYQKLIAENKVLREKYDAIINGLQESKTQSGKVNKDILQIGDSYRWMAEKVEEYSDVPFDYMALAGSEFRKIADLLDKALGDK